MKPGPDAFDQCMDRIDRATKRLKPSGKNRKRAAEELARARCNGCARVDACHSEDGSIACPLGGPHGTE